MEIGNWYVNPEMQPEEIDKRREAAQQWVDGMREVVERTHDSEALALFNGILSEIAVGRPNAERHLIPVQGPEQPTIILVPFFTEDTDINNMTRLLTDPNSSNAAIYTENKPGRVFFNAEVPLSPLFKGLLMLHEAKHAEFFETNQFRDNNELDHWHEEAAAFEFEFRLLQKLCGKAYEEFMYVEVARFIQEYDDKDGRGGTLPKPSSVDISIVDKIFGPSLSKREHDLRQSVIWMDGTSRMFDIIYPDTSARDKALFQRQVATQ